MNGMSITTRWSPSRIALKRATARGTAVSARIDHLPMLSAVVFLLIAMMIATALTSSRHRGWPMHIPQTFSAAPRPAADREDVVKVSVTRDGRVFFRNMQIVVNDLPDLIRKAVYSGSERKVYLAVDQRARYVDVAPVLDQIRAAGITQICFLAERMPPR